MRNIFLNFLIAFFLSLLFTFSIYFLNSFFGVE